MSSATNNDLAENACYSPLCNSVFLEIKGDAVLERVCPNMQHAIPKWMQLKFALNSAGMTKINVRGDCLFSWQAWIQYGHREERLQHLEGWLFSLCMFWKASKVTCFGREDFFSFNRRDWQWWRLGFFSHFLPFGGAFSFPFLGCLIFLFLFPLFPLLFSHLGFFVYLGIFIESF